MSEKKRHWILRGILAIGSAILYVLSFPTVRNWIWKKAIKKGKEKIVDAEAKIVKE